MTPRRRLRCALTALSSGLVAAALVGCSNGVHVAGPTKPHESVISAATSPSAAASSAKPKDNPKATASPTADDTTSGAEGKTSGGQDSDDSTGTGENAGNGQGRKNGSSGKGTGGSQHKKHSGGQGIGSPSATATGKSGDAGASDNGSGAGTETNRRGRSTGSDPKDSDVTPQGRTCKLDNLSVGARVPAGSGAAGSQYVLITFTNRSGAPCWMYGYAGVSFVGNQDGTQLGKPARRAKSVSASPVKLSRGDTQTELLKIADAGVWDAEECAPTTSDGFRIYPPSSYTAAYVKFATSACQSKSVRQLTVFPVGTKS